LTLHIEDVKYSYVDEHCIIVMAGENSLLAPVVCVFADIVYT